MHTLRLTMIGLVLLSVFVFVAAQINQRKNKLAVDGARIFIWLWLAIAAINFCFGVFVAGYSVATEIVVFGLPAGVAWYLSRKSGCRSDRRRSDLTSLRPCWRKCE